MTQSFSVSGNIVDVREQRVFPGTVHVRDGRIASIEPGGGPYATHLMPGFIDAHVHVESSMLVPAEFARMAAPRGTVATVSDPHEIANVLGVAGVEYMLAGAVDCGVKIHFGAPSCVPATGFETAGAVMGPEQVKALLSRPEIRYLSEMMNWPGVLFGDPGVRAKIAAAHELGKPIDGHAPGVVDDNAKRYASAGITTDHECVSRAEAIDKIMAGMKILIREGSAAKNFDALHLLIDAYPDRVMFCTDDMHPDRLRIGQIDILVRRAIELGHGLFNVLRAACLNPILHYGLDVGTLRVGDPADFIEVDDLKYFGVLRTWVDGKLTAEKGKPTRARRPATEPNQFGASPKNVSDFAHSASKGDLHVIGAIDGQIVTEHLRMPATVKGGRAVQDPSRDLLKIAVVNRYSNAAPAVAFIHGFGLSRGALAATVAHDSHNIVAVGAGDEDLCAAVNALVACKGGLAAVSGSQREVLPLPVAGLMTTADGWETAVAYEKLNAAVAAWGCKLGAPFMTLSFMALLVIPSLKLSDKGLFDGSTFTFVAV